MTLDLKKIGFISGSHGFKGDVKIALEVELLSSKLPEFLFIHIDGKPVPFFVLNFKITDQHIILHFEDVNEEKDAQAFKNTSIYCETKCFEKYFDKTDSLEDLIDFSVTDKRKGNIGMVNGIIENSMQPTLIILYQEKEILIPYNEDIIEEIDEANKHIFVNAPDGLIEMYLE